ncbi:MAG TPA: ferritin [Anaerolineales bacterium]|nr:ferritin [Anaerolineales bacterium]
MLISERLAAAMSEQVGRELGASNQYAALGAYFDAEALDELATFFYRQSDEERMHAMKFLHYVADAGGKVVIPAVPAPKSDIDSAETAAKLALDWELEVTREINALMDIAVQEKDHIAHGFLEWFANEQLEEVNTMNELHAVIRRAGKDGLLLVEQYLARRGDPHAGGVQAAG